MLEVVITIGLVGVLIFIGLLFSGQIQDINNRNSYREQQNIWAGILQNFQDNHLSDAVEGVINIPENNITMTITPEGVGACGSEANQNALGNMITSAGLTDDRLLINPWGGGWCLVVGSVAFLPVDGTGISIGLRPMAIFSAGRGGFNTTITNLVLACPESEGDDSNLICNNGAAGAFERVRTTQARLDELGQQVALYSRARAASIPQGGFVDYFLSGAPTSQPTGCDAVRTLSAYVGDPDSPFPTTADESSDRRGMQLSEIAANALFFGAVGISPNQIFDGFNESIWMDNSSCDVRHPFNSNENLNAPPFSARFTATLPGGQNLTKIIFTDF